MDLPVRLREAFQLLELEPTSDLLVLKASYRKLALLHHPDKNQSADEERFKAISAAYEDICKHIKGQEEVDYEDPDFQLIYELLHLFNMLEADNTDASSPVEGYASGGSSCEADSDDGDEASEATDSDAAESQGFSDNDEVEEADDPSDQEPITPGLETTRHDHVCHGVHMHGACSHNIGIPFPRNSQWTVPTENVKPEDLQPLRQRSLQSQPSTGKKRVETDMERKVRVKLLLVEQEIARERREKEEKEKKEAARLAREQEKNEAAARRAAKNAKKRAAAREKAALAKESAKAKALAEQEERLRIFDQLTACAKLHNPDEYYGALDKVKQGIVDNNISVVGWAKTSLPNDIEKEDRNVDGGGTTLLHLAVQASDSDLVDWLCERGARPDERDSEGFTPFHRALENGDKRMLDYFFETFPPLDCDGQENPVNMKIYNPVDRNDMSTSLVFLATLSGDVEVVDYVLDKASIREVKYAWRFVQSQLRKCRYHKMPSDDWEEVLQMLEQKEGFVPPVVEQGRRQYGQPRQL